MIFQAVLLDIDLTATESTLLIMLLTGLVGGLIYFIKKYIEKIDRGKEIEKLSGKSDNILEEITNMKLSAVELRATVENTNVLVHEMRKEYKEIIKRVYQVEKDCSVKHAKSKPEKEEEDDII